MLSLTAKLSCVLYDSNINQMVFSALLEESCIITVNYFLYGTLSDNGLKLCGSYN